MILCMCLFVHACHVCACMCMFLHICVYCAVRAKNIYTVQFTFILRSRKIWLPSPVKRRQLTFGQNFSTSVFQFPSHPAAMGTKFQPFAKLHPFVHCGFKHTIMKIKM
jgi:hypothetical protein